MVQDEEVVLLGSPRFLVRLELLLRTQQASLWARYLRYSVYLLYWYKRLALLVQNAAGELVGALPAVLSLLALLVQKYKY